MKRWNKKAAVLAATLLATMGAQAAPYFYWNGSVSTNWHDEGNWTIDRRGASTTNLIPEIGDVTYINEMPANLPTLSTVATTLTLRVAYAAGTFGTLNIVDGADLSVAANRDRVGLGGGQGVVNQSGGSAELNYFGIGVGAGSVGEYNLSGGTLKMKASSTLAGVASTSMSLGDGGTGTFNLTGGELETIRGVTLGGSTTGIGTFNVFGAGVANVGGRNDAAAGFWNQGEFSTLSATVDSDNGFSLGQINIIGGSNETTSVTFQFGSTLQLGFSGADMGDVTNSWDLITFPEGTAVVDNGLALTNTDTDVWSFAFTNNALRVTYGIADTSVAPTNPPPSSPRILYWTGNGGDTSATNGPNWDEDLAGTAATWGIYDYDTAYIGHDSVNAADFDSEVTYDGGAAVINQNSLYIGRNRTGIFNFNDGFLKFLSNNTRKNHFIGWGGPSGDGTLNVNGGELWIYATELGNQPGASGALNLNGGDLVLSGRANSTGDSLGYGTLWVGPNGGAGYVNVKAGSLTTLIGVTLGDATGTGSFTVQGSGATRIGIGAYRSDFDGFWTQNSGSRLTAIIDGGGITPIEIIETGQANTPTEGEADVIFEAGSILDVGWAAGVTNYGVFDVMKFGGTYVDNGLALDPAINTDIWSFEFVDTDADSTNDTLRVTADPGTTANGTPILWLYAHGLTELDDEVDNDLDGLLSWQEYVAGTDPTNMASVLTVNSTEVDGVDYILNWQSVEGKSYSVITNTDLQSGTPGVEASGIAGLPVETSYTTTVSGASAVFYEIGVE